ncbi:MAG: aminotransferase class III-fold pyridoxal phosphate-dependent enzyme [Acidobacteriota bacterium]|jgi:glutamate-1-semialdehyde aminotransferase
MSPTAESLPEPLSESHPTGRLRYAESLAKLERASRYVVDGVKRANRLDDPAHYPLFFERASGPHAWDVDGHRYIDLIAGKGTVLLGYASPEVDSAVRMAIGAGSMLPLTGPLHPLAAERLCRAVPSVERVKFLRTGSEAVSAAVRLARVWSGERKILTCGYHGWHGWYVEQRRSVNDSGAPVVDFHYDVDALEALLSRYAKETAAVVVSPEPALLGDDHHRRLAEVVREHGVLLLFDEVKSGFRFGSAGYQGSVGVRPDLTTFGKAIANGYVLAAVGGRREVMEAERETHISGTYETENVGLAAALRTMEILGGSDYGELFGLYRRFAAELNAAFRRRGVAARCLVSGANAQILFEDDDLARCFYRRAVAHGVLFNCFDDVNLTFGHRQVFEELLAAVVDVVDGLDAIHGRGRELSPAAVHRYLSRRGVILGDCPPSHPVVAAVHSRALDA